MPHNFIGLALKQPIRSVAYTTRVIYTIIATFPVISFSYYIQRDSAATSRAIIFYILSYLRKLGKQCFDNHRASVSEIDVYS